MSKDKYNNLKQNCKQAQPKNASNQNTTRSKCLDVDFELVDKFIIRYGDESLILERYHNFDDDCLNLQQLLDGRERIHAYWPDLDPKTIDEKLQELCLLYAHLENARRAFETPVIREVPQLTTPSTGNQ